MLFDELARILAKVEEDGIWPEGLLDAKLAKIPKVDGNEEVNALWVVCRIWATACVVQLEDWFPPWVPDSVYGAGGGRSSVEAWLPQIWILRRCLLAPLTPMYMSLLLISLTPLTPLIVGFLVGLSAALV